MSTFRLDDDHIVLQQNNDILSLTEELHQHSARILELEQENQILREELADARRSTELLTPEYWIARCAARFAEKTAPMQLSSEDCVELAKICWEENGRDLIASPEDCADEEMGYW